MSGKPRRQMVQGPSGGGSSSVYWCEAQHSTSTDHTELLAWVATLGAERGRCPAGGGKREVVSHKLRKSVNRRREEKLGTEKGVCIRTSNNVILFISDVQSTLNGVIRTHARRGWREKTNLVSSSSTILLSSGASATKSWAGRGLRYRPPHRVLKRGKKRPGQLEHNEGRRKLRIERSSAQKVDVT